jgi:hypothetical protein
MSMNNFESKLVFTESQRTIEDHLPRIGPASKLFFEEKTKNNNKITLNEKISMTTNVAEPCS